MWHKSTASCRTKVTHFGKKPVSYDFQLQQFNSNKNDTHSRLLAHIINRNLRANGKEQQQESAQKKRPTFCVCHLIAVPLNFRKQQQLLAFGVVCFWMSAASMGLFTSKTMLLAMFFSFERFPKYGHTYLDWAHKPRKCNGAQCRVWFRLN